MSDQAFEPVPVTDFTMFPVKSSMISAVGYVNRLSVMQIRFKPEVGESVGPLYQYSEISRELYDELLDADSIGKAFTRLVKNKPQYPCVQVIEDQPA